MFQRKFYETMLQRLREPRRFIQVLLGPRQTGKTTLILQVLDSIGLPSHYVSTDSPEPRSSLWIEEQWEVARIRQKAEPRVEQILVIDEIQKIPGWTETVKKLWDEDTREKRPIKVVLLGSSPLLVQKGISESLAGRYEIVRIPHWSFSEMREAFGFNLDRFLYFGGYPGAAPLIENEERWKSYVKDSLIETTVSKDILMMTRVDKPALLKRLFEIGCVYSGRILSYTKILGQFQEAGNTTTLAHYLDLLNSAGLMAGLQKYSPQKFRQRGSSPKFQVLNTAFISAQSEISFGRAKMNFEFWGRLVESAVGAHLLNISTGTNVRVYYWRESQGEVDFILTKEDVILAIEVKSGKKRELLPGLETFAQKYPACRKLLVGREGLGLEEFLTLSLDELF